MRVLNICVNGVYTDGFTYQENLLPKFHKKNGNDVYILASMFEFNNNGKAQITNRENYTDENGIHIIRVPIKHGKGPGYQFKRFDGFYQAIEEILPDVIFCHLFQFIDVLQVLKYIKRHPDVILYVDSHADFGNSARSWLSKNILHKIIWRYCAQKLLPYTKKFYGVLPARVDFLKEMYGLPEGKCELLVMGADDELVEKTQKNEARKSFREKRNIMEGEFLIVTGGKLDRKKNTIELISAVKRFPKNKVKLLIFGSVDPELQDTFYSLCDGVQVQYLGWMNTEQSYDAFSAADLVVFPGLHSVYWEQTAGLGIPMLVRKLPGVDHIDMDGNVRYLRSGMRDDIFNGIKDIVDNPEDYHKMKVKALQAQKTFSYKEIAFRSLR